MEEINRGRASKDDRGRLPARVRGDWRGEGTPTGRSGRADLLVSKVVGGL